MSEARSELEELRAALAASEQRAAAAEADLARARRVRWGARTCDLDLLGVENTVLPDRAETRTFMALTKKSTDRMQISAPSSSCRVITI